MSGLIQVFSDEPKLHQQALDFTQDSNVLTAGPILFDGLQYAVFVNTLTNAIAIWKSADGWATKQQVGSAQPCAANTAANPSRGSGWESYALDIHPSLPEVYVGFVGTDDRVRIGIFDLSSEAWSAIITGGPDFSGFRSDPLISGPIARLDLNYRLSTDEFVVAYMPWAVPLVEGTGAVRNEIVICTRAGVWSAPIVISRHWNPVPPEAHDLVGMVTVNAVGYSRTHLFFPQGNTVAPSNPSNTIQHATFSETNVLGTFQVLYTFSTGGPNFEFPGIGKPKADNLTGEVILPFWIFRANGSSSASVHLASAISAVLPSWTIETIKSFVTNWNFTQVQAGYPLGAMVPIFFSALTVTEYADGRGSPYWDQDAETWYVEAPSTVGRIFVCWREKRSGSAFVDSNNLAYTERVSPGSWAASQTLVLRSEYDPADEPKFIYQIDLGLPAGAAPVVPMFPEFIGS